mmetsp:Transcript_598/g.763  ORF Transcript_598/g.763 Transcript_598/m.763 type:complete len:219 (-) Transcript_598:215-871(-)|eukprot:CAMPEP_0185725248 /NCGR_PEP_ID=MMETSP1171-20130828/1540_1 /TAXON_ID=374046 /ORGANISM="Helicotheca tamensis, Strain CCMP826" /LENGTH=218 /DNA_ID=CAMNT_0028393319 /DNA_START=69 /DNA_END=725 /DNA_ORIENTATION=+
MRTIGAFFLTVTPLLLYTSVAFTPSSTNLSLKKSHSRIVLKAANDDANVHNNKMTTSSRREHLLQSTAFIASSIFASSVQPANASGGATAGGAYLLSAKQRYNERVTKGIKAFLDLDERSIADVNAFFATDEVGGWKDASTAGYLLANAFRRNSTTAPDSLPSVKKWKAFAKEVETMAKYAGKKKSADTFNSYKKALVLLDEYLEAVELPPAIEIKTL